MDGSHSSDPDGDPLTYTWDINGDGVFGDATGVKPTLTWAQLKALGIVNGPSSFNVSLRVDDGQGHVVTSSPVALTVLNVAPTVDAGSDQYVNEEDTVNLSGAFTDPGNADTHIFDWSVVADNGQVIADGTQSTFSFVPNDNGNYVVTFTVTDSDGGVGSAVVNVEVADVAPVTTIVGAPAQGVVGVPINLSSTVTDISPVDTAAGFQYYWEASLETDAAIFFIGQSADFSFTPPEEGTYAIFLYGLDKDGGTSSDFKEITVNATTVNGDTTPPTITVPANQIDEATGPNGATATFTATATDLVTANPLITYYVLNNNLQVPVQSGDTFALGTTTVFVQAVDDAGNTATDSFTITVRDTTPPTIAVPANQIDEATGPNGATATFAATASDLVTAQPLISYYVVANNVQVPVHSGDTFALGTTTVFAQAQDAAGNTASKSFTITVRDTTPPTITVPANQIDEATGPNGATATFAATASDLVTANPQISYYVLANNVQVPVHSGDTFALGTTTVFAQAQDAAGNTASKSFTITVRDTTPPTITVPANQIDEATGPNGATATFAATATDLVTANPQISYYVLANNVQVPVHSGDTFALGTTTVFAQAQDAAGNTASKSFTITVRDTTPPTITVPANQIDEATGPNGATATFAATATDLVTANPQISYYVLANNVQVPVHSGDTFALGTTTVFAQAQDAAGNTASKSFTITVRDTTPPTITVPVNQTDEATGPSGATATFAATASDLVTANPQISYYVLANNVQVPVHSGDTFALGTTTVFAQAQDAAGNTASKSFTITVRDTTPPTITVPANQIDEATGPNGATATFAATASDLVTANPQISYYVLANNVQVPVHSGDTFALGTTTVFAQAQDTAGNTASKSFQITVRDTTPPTITVPANVTVTATGAGRATVSFTATATDVVDGAVPSDRLTGLRQRLLHRHNDGQPEFHRLGRQQSDQQLHDHGQCASCRRNYRQRIP